MILDRFKLHYEKLPENKRRVYNIEALKRNKGSLWTPNMSKSTIRVIAIIILILTAWGLHKSRDVRVGLVEPVYAQQQTQTANIPPEPEKAVKPPEIKSEKELRALLIANNPKNCTKDQWILWPDGKCKDKTQPATKSYGSGSCQTEIKKYDWNIDVAMNVAKHESGLNPGALNNNPATKDYSVGCFQINLYGSNAKYRPSEAQLKIASINVAFAYKLYVDNGHSFIGQWGVCRSIYCY